jgi:hypothetical protein
MRPVSRVFYLALSLLEFLQVTLNDSQQKSQQAYGTAVFHAHIMARERWRSGVAVDDR